MINKMMLHKAYTEVLEILKLISKDAYDKVPKYIIENMEQERDNSYKFEVNSLNDFSKQKIIKQHKGE